MKKKQQDTAEVKRLTVPEGYDGPMLDIRDLRVIYKTDLETVEAINGISLRIGKGKTFGLVGETGAGKTTTALSILRLLPHNTGRILNGEILFNGVNLLDEDEEVMRAVRGNLISMVFQDPMSALNPVYTVGDQIGEAVALHNPDFTKEQVEERVDEMLKLVGIMPSRKHDYPHQFSGGMKQRVVIAMALACNPRFLIADEPTTALDVTIQAQVLELMKKLKAQYQTAMVMITHDLGIVAEICDYVAIMYAGEVVEYGTREHIFNSTAHPYTKGLFACIPDIFTEQNELVPINGLTPDPTDLPQGCRFNPRCPYATERCRQEHPENVEIEPGHFVACHLINGGGNENA